MGYTPQRVLATPYRCRGWLVASLCLRLDPSKFVPGNARPCEPAIRQVFPGGASLRDGELHHAHHSTNPDARDELGDAEVPPVGVPFQDATKEEAPQVPQKLVVAVTQQTR